MCFSFVVCLLVVAGVFWLLLGVVGLLPALGVVAFLQPDMLGRAICFVFEIVGLVHSNTAALLLSSLPSLTRKDDALFDAITS